MYMPLGDNHTSLYCGLVLTQIYILKDAAKAKQKSAPSLRLTQANERAAAGWPTQKTQVEIQPPSSSYPQQAGSSASSHS